MSVSGGGSLVKGNASTTTVGVPIFLTAPANMVISDGALVLSGGGVWTGAVSTQQGGSLQFVAGSFLLNVPASLNGTTGSLVVAGSSSVRVNVGIALGSAAAINVTSGQLFVSGNSTVTEDAPIVVASGTVAVTQPTTFTSLVTVNGGSLNITADVNMTGGILVLSGNVFVLGGRVLVGGGGCSIAGGYLFVATAQSLVVTVPCSQSAGSLDGPGTFSFSALAWSGGSWTGLGSTSLQGMLTISSSVSVSRSVGVDCVVAVWVANCC